MHNNGSPDTAGLYRSVPSFYCAYATYHWGDIQQVSAFLLTILKVSQSRPAARAQGLSVEVSVEPKVRFPAGQLGPGWFYARTSLGSSVVCHTHMHAQADQQVFCLF